MGKSESTNVPGLEILKYFQNEDYSVKVFQMLFKYYIVSQKYVLTPGPIVIKLFGS
jgi:hypothetical protein